MVTYRGTEIGRVRSLDVTATGVRAVLTLDTAFPVRGEVTAAVHSRSAIGEQFLELNPGDKPGAEALADGDVIPAARPRIQGAMRSPAMAWTATPTR